MYAESFFVQAVVYLAAAVVAVPIAKRLGLGSVLGYLIAGVVIGPFGLHLVGEEGEDVMHFAEFGVVLMLFLIGLELEPRRLWRLRGPILGLGGLQVAVTTVILAGLGLAAGAEWRVALAVGAILSLSSTAMVLQTLAEKGWMRSESGQSAFSVLLFQDIAVIPMLALMPLLATGNGAAAASGDGSGDGHAEHATTWIGSLPPWGQAVAVLAAVAIVVVVGRYLARPAFSAIATARQRELFTAAALLLVIGIALLMTRVGLSPALGTFLAGVVLATSEYRHQLEADIEPFKGLLLGLFFIAVGASVDFRLIAASPTTVAVIVAVLVLAKLAVLAVLARSFRMSLDQGLLFAVVLAQGGEFAFVLSSFALQQGIFGQEVAAPVIAGVAVSMALTPLLLLATEKFLLPRVGTRTAVAERQPDVIEERNRVVIAGFGRFGNVVGRLLRAQGIVPTVLEIDSDRVDLVRKLGLPVFYGDATRVDLLHSAGADDAELLIIAIDDPERIRSLVHSAQKHFPHLRLLVRASDRPDSYELIDDGLSVSSIYRETFDSALRLGADALELLGVRAYTALRAARTFRRDDQDSITELASMRHDQGSYLSRARERIRALERVMLDAATFHVEERDAGWDVDSLRRDVALLNAGSPPADEAGAAESISPASAG
ncbi:MAG: monovalent cation:proton antiporter-2 (CPA2) family protein, partial [Acidobacteriota bacterium]